MADSADPGWPWTWWVLVGCVSPPSIEKRQRVPTNNDLIEIRRMVVGYLIGFPVFGAIVVAVASLSHRSANHRLAFALLALAAIIRFGVVRRFEEPLVCESSSALRQAWKRRYFARVAASNFAGIVGFVGYLVTGAVWLFPTCAAVGILGFVQLAPSKRNLAADQRRLNANKCELSLIRVLTEAPTEHA